MASYRGCLSALALALLALAAGPARADQTAGTVVTAPDAATPSVTPPKPAKPAPAAPNAAPGTTTTPLVGLDSGALALVPPGSAAEARYSGMAGSPQTGVDLTYIPPAERDSYINSRDFADHLQTSIKGGRHPSALSQLGGAAEGMAINGALMGIEGLTLGVH